MPALKEPITAKSKQYKDVGTQMFDEGDFKVETDVAENRRMLVTVDVS